MTSHALDPSPLCNKLSHVLGPPRPSSVTYFMDGPVWLNFYEFFGFVTFNIAARELIFVYRLYSYSFVLIQRSTSYRKTEIIRCQGLASFQTLGSGGLEQLVSNH